MNINNIYLNGDLYKEIYIILLLDYLLVISTKNKILLL